MNSDEDPGLQAIGFVVDERPHVFWEYNVREKNREFLSGLNPSFFRHVVEAYQPQLEDDERRQSAALGVRTAYAQALETFFALLASAIQAPDCPVGWMLSYQTSQLRSVVLKLLRGEQIYSKLKGAPLTFENIAVNALQFRIDGDDERTRRIIERFGGAWKRFARDFTSQELIDEYNSAKHGLRVRSTGFSIAIGREETPGVAAPRENMKTIGGGEFGSTFFTREKQEPKYAYGLTQHSLNWVPENLIFGVLLLEQSIANLISYLQILNGAKPEDCRFTWPAEDGVFDKPWALHTGVNSMRSRSTLPKELPVISRDRILSIYEAEEAQGDPHS